MTYIRLELVDRVTKACARHEAPVWECAGCQRASVIVVQSAMTGQPTLKGVAGAPVRTYADVQRVLEYDRKA